MISNHRSAMNQIKTAQEDIMRVKQRVQNVEDTLLKITKEFRMVARKEDIDVIKRYVELWDPVKFVTLEQVERMINQALNHAPETTPEAEIESEPAEETAPEDQSEEETEEEPEQTDEDFESLVKKHNV